MLLGLAILTGPAVLRESLVVFLKCPLGWPASTLRLIDLSASILNKLGFLVARSLGAKVFPEQSFGVPFRPFPGWIHLKMLRWALTLHMLPVASTSAIV